MKFNPRLPIPTLVLCLAIVVPASFAAETPTKSAPEKTKVQTPPADSTRQTLQRMTETLKLDASQQNKVKKVLEASDAKMNELRSNKKLTPQDFGLKARELRAANDQQLREILTPEQYQEWQKILSQRGNRRRAETPANAAAAPKPGSSPSSGSQDGKK